VTGKDKPEDKKIKPPDLLGPFRLNSIIIDGFVKRAPGVYMLTRADLPPGTILFVGRSREDLRKTLHSHLPEFEVYRALKKMNPDRFYFQHQISSRVAYQLECILYHYYEPQLNRYHPDPDLPGWTCPVCGR